MAKMTNSINLFLILFLSVTVFNASAQWQQDTFPTTTVTPQRLYAYDADTALVSCTKGTVFKTTNGGLSWTDISPQNIPSKNLLDIDFRDTIGAMVTYDTILITTTDLGINWDIKGLSNLKTAFPESEFKLDSASNKQLSSLCLINDTTLISAFRFKDSESTYHNFIIKSTDFGENWIRVSDDFSYNQSIIITTIKFNGDNGYATGSKGTFLKSSNSGNSWELVPFENELIGSNYLADFEILGNDSLAIASTNQGVILVHHNLDSVHLLLDGRMNDILILNDSLYIAAGGGAETYRSSNRGQTWELANNGLSLSTFELTEFNGKVYGLSNKGRYITASPDEFYTPTGKIELITDNNLISVSSIDLAKGSFTWSISGDLTNEKSGESSQFTVFNKGEYSINLTVTNTLGDFYFTQAGISVEELTYQWETTTFPTSETLVKMSQFNSGEALLFANNSTILRTEDDGLTWSDVTLPSGITSQICNSTAICNDSTAIASFTGKSSADGYILYTTDKGQTWQKAIIDIPQVNLDSYNYFRFYSANNINDTLALSMVRYDMAGSEEEFYFLIKSNDQGKSWTQFSPYNFAEAEYSSVINNINADTALNSIIINGYKRYWHSADAGLTWQIIDATEMGSINDAMPTEDGYIFAAQKGTFHVNAENATILNDQYAFDAVFTPNDSLIISGKNEATTYIANKDGEKWIPFGTGLTSTYYDYAVLGDWIYALRKGSESYRTPVWFAEKQKDIIDSTNEPLIANQSSYGLYPNPAQPQNSIYLDNTYSEDALVYITDITGKAAGKQMLKDNSFIAPNKPGIYLITIKEDRRSRTYKLIIK